MTRRSTELDLLLSTRPLEGNQPAGRAIGPELLTSVVDATSLTDAREAIGEHCCFWGGGCSILIPADPTARAIEQPWLEIVRGNRLDHVPLADQPAAALERMSRREHFTSPDDLVFCNMFGRALDDSALRRRYRRAQTAVGVRPLRFHDLRHTFSSLLAMPRGRCRDDPEGDGP